MIPNGEKNIFHVSTKNKNRLDSQRHELRDQVITPPVTIKRVLAIANRAILKIQLIVLTKEVDETELHHFVCSLPVDAPISHRATKQPKLNDQQM